MFFPLLFSSSSLLIAEWPPSLQRTSVRLVESIDYHGAVLDGAVWLDACNCGVIKHWHWGFNGGLSNSLTFSAARRGEHAINSCWRETKEEVCSLCWIGVHSRVFMVWRSVMALVQSLIHVFFRLDALIFHTQPFQVTVAFSFGHHSCSKYKINLKPQRPIKILSNKWRTHNNRLHLTNPY